MTIDSLTQLTALLSVGLGEPEPADLEGIVWEDLLELANDHLLTPALFAAFQRREDLSRVPGEVASYLRFLSGANARRNEMLHKQAIEVGRALNDIGISPMFLKSTADLMEMAPVLGDDGIVGDVDVLVPGNMGADAAAALTRRGYQIIGEPNPCSHAYADLSRPSDAAKVDLHVQVLDTDRLLPSNEFWSLARQYSIGGVHFCLPSPESRVLHRALHNQIQDGQLVTGRLLLSHAWRTAWMINHHGGEIDWAWIQKHADDRGLGAALGIDALATRLFGAEAPVRPTSVAALAHKWRMIRLRYPGLEIPGGPTAVSLVQYLWARERGGATPESGPADKPALDHGF